MRLTERPHPKPIRAAAALAGIVSALALAAPSSAAAAECRTSGPAGGYSVTVCLDAPAGGATLTGDTQIDASVSVTGTTTKIAKLAYHLDDDGVRTDADYLLTDYEAPWTFTLPSHKYANGSKRLEVEVEMRDGFTTETTGVDLTLDNGPGAPVVNSNQFTPSSGTAPAPGRPFVLANVGDGASGEQSASDVMSRIESWAPNLFVYSGDVYDKGTTTEFRNWGEQYFGGVRDITNPAIGNHEYENGLAPGYFDYWDNVPHYYSYDAGGWHFVSLDTTNQFGETAPGSGQYEWLRQDLESNTAQCTVAYMHHPTYNIGPEGEPARVQDFWRLLHQNGVDIVLAAHDHSYQRWRALDADGQVDLNGMTQFIVGTGGHGTQEFIRSDDRVASAITKEFGAQRLELNSEGAAYSFVTSGGVTLDSGSVQCRGTGADMTAPTAPSGLTAVAQRQTQVVDLNWTNSMDNVGVTGYEIYRNGTLLTETGPETTYSDSSVAAGSSYSYEVRAIDTAENRSEPSNAATAQTDDLAILFYSGLETGDMSRWTVPSGSAIVAQQAQVFSGSWAARGTAATTGIKNYAYRNLAANAQLYTQMRFKVLSQGPGTLNLMALKTGTGGKLLTLYRSSTGKLGFRNEVTMLSTTSSKVVTAGAWHTLQVRLRVGSPGDTDVWLDGAPVSGLSTSSSFGTTPIGRVEIGDASTTKTYDVAFDEVAVDPAPIADTTDPLMSDRLEATSSSGLEVALSWDAAADDVGVTGYEIYRDGELLTTTAGPVATFKDHGVTPNSSYYYEVRARDAAGNVSHFTDIATVDTPAVFDDDFESGTVVKWTLTSGLNAQQAERYSGAWGGRATSTSGTPGYGLCDLPTDRPELYYRARFRLIGQGATSVNLLRFRHADGGAVLTLSASSSGLLSARNDAASGATRTSAAVVSDGAWHEIQVQLDAVSGTTEVTLDGDRITALSGPDTYPGGQLGQIELGERTSGRTFDLAFDDVRVDTSPIADTTPPTRPTGLTATATAPDRVDLSWTAATDNIDVDGYDVYRNGRLLTHIEPATSYVDRAVTAQTAYTYELRATDASENESATSNTASVTTPGDDGAIPSRPTGLTATATSGQPSHVDLAWTASTDDIAVAGYRVHRNGALIATIGPLTTYRDSSVAPGSDVSYVVEAVDGSENVSEPSAPAAARVALFADGFETGNVARWTSVTGGFAAGSTEVLTGAYAARATSTGSPSYAYGILGTPGADVVADLRFKVLSASTNVYLMKLRTATGGSIIGLYRSSSNGRLTLRNDVAATTTTNGTVVSLNEWHQLEVRAHVAGAQGETEVWLDGTRIGAMSVTANLGTTNVGRLQLGDNSSSRTFDVAFDDVSVDEPAVVVVRKVTTPATATTFSFAGDVPLGTFALAGGQEQTRTVRPGTYGVTEGADPAGWRLAEIACSDAGAAQGASSVSGRTATIRAAAGETVTCTFDSEQEGRIEISKQTDPADTGTPKERFAFTGDAPLGAFDLADDELQAATVAAGDYAVTEAAEPGYVLAGIACDDANSSTDVAARQAVVRVEPGETVRCSFTNTELGAIEIGTQTDPADTGSPKQQFAYTGDVPLGPFTLEDGQSTSAAVVAGTYTVTQDAAAGYDVSALACDDANSTTDVAAREAVIRVEPGETVRCTYTNTERGEVTIEQQTNPDATPGSFTFASTDVGALDGAILGDGDRRSAFVTPARYAVSQVGDPGWLLESLTCDDSGQADPAERSEVDLATRSVIFDVQPGERVVCAFTNAVVAP